MLLKTLKGRHLLLLIFVPFLILGFWLPSFVDPKSLTGSIPQMPLYNLLQNITGHSLIALNICGWILAVIMAFLMVRLNERYVFIRQRTVLPAFIFAVIFCGTISLKGVHPSFLSAFLLFLAIDRVFSIYHGASTLSKSFDVGLLLGLATLFYLFSVFFFIWFCISLAILGYFRGREIFAGLLGFTTPVFLVVCWYFWFDALDQFIENVNQLYHLHHLVLPVSIFQQVFWGVLGLLLVLSSLYMINVVEEKKISSRKYFMILLIFFTFCLAIYFLFTGAGIELYYLAVIPLTYILSHYFVLQKHKWIGEVLFLILILSSLLLVILR